MHPRGGRILLQRPLIEVSTRTSFDPRASFGTTKYCNSFIHNTPCTNQDCLYLHHKAPPEDCFLREEMTAGDRAFYKRTHPGFGSFWDSRRGVFVYHRRNALRSGDKLPENQGKAEEISNCLRKYSRMRFEVLGKNYEVGVMGAIEGRRRKRTCLHFQPI